MKRFLFSLLALCLLAIPAGSQSSISGWDGSTYRTVLTPYAWDGSVWRTGIQAWGWDGSTWRAAFSTISASASGGAGSASGAAGSGAVSVGISATVGGNPIGTPAHHWACVGGDCAQGINNVALASPTISKTVGVAACQAGANSSATWQDTVTDPATSITSLSNGVSASLTWNNTTSCLGPFSVNASGSSRTGSGFTSAFNMTGTGSVDSFSGGPVSGSMSYSWTYVSGATGTATGTSTANMSFTSVTQFCSPASTCPVSSRWNVHVVDLVSGFSADAQVDMNYEYNNNNG